MKTGFALMKTAAVPPNEAKSPLFLISERSERLHFFIREASSFALTEGDFIFFCQNTAKWRVYGTDFILYTE